MRALSPKEGKKLVALCAGFALLSLVALALSGGVSCAPLRFALNTSQSAAVGASGTWTRGNTYGFSALASSADGEKLLASNKTHIMASDDGGQTWRVFEPNPGEDLWGPVASANDGSTLLIATLNDNVYVVHQGVWFSGGVLGATALAASGDGTSFFAATPAHLYTAQEPADGSSPVWVLRNSVAGSPSQHYSSVASSADGKIVFATVDFGYIYISQDGGITWQPETSAGQRDWSDIAVSADGTKVIAAAYNSDYVYLSKDGGTTWAPATSAGARDWKSVASSADGSVLAAAEGAQGAGYLYFSIDAGTTWTLQTAPGPGKWYGLAMSSDGSSVAASDITSNYLWTYEAPPPPPEPTLSISGNGQTGSITVPVGTPVTIAATFTPGAGDTLTKTAINDRIDGDDFLWCGSDNTCSETMWTQAPLNAKSYTFATDTIGSYIFDPSTQTSAYPAWNNYGASLTVNVLAQCQNGQGTENNCTSCNAGYTLSGGQCVPQCPHGQGPVGSCTSCDSPYMLEGTAPTNQCVAPPAGHIVKFSSLPSRVRPGNAASLSWSTTDMTSCSLKDDSGNTLSTALNSAGTPTGAISRQITYTLSCTDGLEEYVASVTVKLVPQELEI